MGCQQSKDVLRNDESSYNQGAGYKRPSILPVENDKLLDLLQEELPNQEEEDWMRSLFVKFMTGNLPKEISPETVSLKSTTPEITAKVENPWYEPYFYRKLRGDNPLPDETPEEDSMDESTDIDYLYNVCNLPTTGPSSQSDDCLEKYLPERPLSGWGKYSADDLVKQAYEVEKEVERKKGRREEDEDSESDPFPTVDKNGEPINTWARHVEDNAGPPQDDVGLDTWDVDDMVKRQQEIFTFKE